LNIAGGHIANAGPRQAASPICGFSMNRPGRPAEGWRVDTLPGDGIAENDIGVSHTAMYSIRRIPFIGSFAGGIGPAIAELDSAVANLIPRERHGADFSGRRLAVNNGRLAAVATSLEWHPR